MKLKEASLFMSSKKVRSPLTDMINIFMTLHEIVFRIHLIKKNIYKRNKKNSHVRKRAP
jgi:hypothetical protein